MVGLFPMCADILHAGHIHALQEAKKHCDTLVVGLNTNPDGKNPIESVYERWSKLAELKSVDLIVPYAGKADMELLAATFDYDIRFLGEDYRDKEWDGKEQEKARGIKPFFISREAHGLSSSQIKERIKNYFG